MRKFFNWPDQQISSKNIFLAILLFGLLHGLLYVFIIPPWQHYDEPTHFEYAWMIANQNRLPQRGEFDNQIRREIQISMVETGFSPWLEIASPDHNNADPIWIGVSQVGDPPLYYILVSIPLRLFSGATVLTQLYVGRIFSVGLFLLIILVSHFWSEILFRPGKLRWLVPLLVAGLPGLVDLTSAMSSDSAAILFYSLYLLCGIRLLKQGPRFFNTGVLIFSLLSCFWTKSSVWVAFLNLPILLAFFLFSQKKRWISWTIIGVGVLTLVVSLFQYDDAAYWFRDTKQPIPSRQAVQIGGLKGHAFQLASDPGGYFNALYQSVPQEQIQKLKGQEVTIGVWVWADKPMDVNAPMFALIGREKSWKGWDRIHLTADPVFYAKTIRLPLEHRRISFVFNPFEDTGSTGIVYYYAPILVPGVFSAGSQPEFIDPGKSRLRWDGVEVTNLIRNSSAEKIWPRFRPWVANLAYKVDYRLGDGLAWLIYSLDFQGVSWYAQGTFTQIFQTFWAKFGWGGISLAGSKPYAPIKAACILGLLGAVIGFYFRYRSTNKRIVFWLASSLMFSIAYAWFTGISTGAFVENGVIPVARFIYPSVLVILSILCFGWYQAFKIVFPENDKILVSVFFISLFLLDTYAIYSIIRAFYP